VSVPIPTKFIIESGSFAIVEHDNDPKKTMEKKYEGYGNQLYPPVFMDAVFFCAQGIEIVNRSGLSDLNPERLLEKAKELNLEISENTNHGSPPDL